MWVALYFSDAFGGVSETGAVGVAFAALALEAVDEERGQSFTTWPELLQNIQSLFSKRRFLSAGVSLPSFLILLERLERGLGVLEDVGVDFRGNLEVFLLVDVLGVKDDDWG
jgi:hypothetical protein